MSNPEDYEPDPDDLPREQLAEHNPMWHAVADTLDEWLHRMHGITSSNHHAGSFLEWLAMNGYRVEPIDPGPIEELLPPTWTHYGSAEVLRLADGTTEVTKADPVIGIHDELWQQLQPPHRRDDLTVQLDTAGQYVYRRIGFDLGGTVHVCERIEEQ